MKIYNKQIVLYKNSYLFPCLKILPFERVTVYHIETFYRDNANDKHELGGR